MASPLEHFTLEEQHAKKCTKVLETVHNIIQNMLQYKRSCARWVTIHLTDTHKETILQISQQLNQRCFIEKEAFFRKIVTCNEAWIYHFELEFKQSLEWKHANSVTRNKFKHVKSWFFLFSPVRQPG